MIRDLDFNIAFVIMEAEIVQGFTFKKSHFKSLLIYKYFSDFGARSERVVMICNRFVLILDNKMGILVIQK